MIAIIDYGVGNLFSLKSSLAAIGREAVVTQAIDNLKAQGQITVNGAPWTARTEEGCPAIPAGSRVRVLRIEGVKVIVSPLPVPTPGR